MKRIGYIEGERISFADDHLLRFGTGKDITIGWDGAALNILPLTNDEGAINFGDGDKQVDVKMFLGAAGAYAEFNVGEGRVNIVGAEIRFAEGAKLEFRSASNYICSGEANVLDIWAGTQTVVRSPAFTVVGAFTAVSTSIFNDNITIATDKKLYFRDTDLYIYSSADGYLNLEANHYIGLTAPQGILVYSPTYIQTTTRVYFGTGDSYICSHEAGKIIVQAGIGAINSIILDPNTAGSIQFLGYLLLDITTTEGDTDGQVWYDPTGGGCIKFRRSGVTSTLNYS